MAVQVYATGMPSVTDEEPFLIREPREDGTLPPSLPHLPIAIWGKVAEYLDLREIQKTRGVCKALNYIVVKLDRHALSALDEPLCDFLFKHSSKLGDSPIPRLSRFLELTPVVKKGRGVPESEELFAISPFAFEEIFSGHTSLSQRFCYKGLERDDFWLAALLCKDQGLSNRFFDLAQKRSVRSSAVDKAARYYLQKNKLGSFRKLLPLTSIFVPDGSIRLPQNTRHLGNLGLLEDFLSLTSEKNISLFEDLLKLNKLQRGSTLLVELAERNRAQAVRVLLRYAKVNWDCIPDNGWNKHNSGTRGIHTALMYAANCNHRETMDALFGAVPSKEILIHIRDLFVRHAELEHAHDICWREWQEREELGPQVRQEIIDLFNEEIARRVPAGLELVDLDMVDLSEFEEPLRLPPILDLGENAAETRRMLLVTAVVAGLGALAQRFLNIF